MIYTAASGAGYYMYIESSGRLENDTADLVSPFLPAEQDFCLSLFVNMYGATMGDLTILTGVIFKFRRFL